MRIEVVILFDRENIGNLSCNTFYVMKRRKGSLRGVVEVIYKLKCVIFCAQKQRKIVNTWKTQGISP